MNGLVLLLLTGCSDKRLDTKPCADSLRSGAYTCDLGGWPDRGYHVVLPEGYTGEPIPVVIDFHGGGGNKDSAARETCENGEPSDPSCIHNALADRETFAVVYPDGHPGEVVTEMRSWNAGGGRGRWRATGKSAVEDRVKDTQFVHDLLDDLEGRMAVDTRRVYAMGLSNGGAMSHRLACTLSDRIAAVAPIGGGLQWTTTHECAPDRAVPTLYIHGTADRCWRYQGGESDCPVGQPGKEHVSVERTLDDLVAVHGCTGEPRKEELFAAAGEDGARTVRWTWEGCDLVHLKVIGGGHTWPDGWQYLGAKIVGPVWREWGDEVLWEFFQEHTLPGR